MSRFFMACAAALEKPKYIPLAYLESTGTQWINTGVAPDFVGGDKIEIGYHNPARLGTTIAFGSRESGVRNGVYATGGTVIVADGSGYSGGGSVPEGDVVLSIDDSHVVINGTSSTTPRRVTCALSVYLFAINNAGTVTSPYSGMRLYYWKYWKNGVLTQHLIPVLDLNNVPCLYDKVSGGFLYNSGTGTFFVPPGTNVPIESQYGVFLKSGTTVLSSAMTMTGTTVYGGEVMRVYNDGVISSTTLSSGGLIYVSSGGMASSATLDSGGTMTVSAGGQAKEPTISSGGRVVVTAGGIASGGTVESKGILDALSGGTIIQPNALYQANVRVFNAGVVSGGVISGGTVTVLSNGSVCDAQFVGRTARCFTSSGGRVERISVSAISGEGTPAIQCFPGGVLASITLSGVPTVYAGAWVQGSGENFIVDYHGSCLIYAGATMSSMVVSSGGSVHVSSGGTALAVTSNAGAVITVADGGYIEYVTQ